MVNFDHLRQGDPVHVHQQVDVSKGFNGQCNWSSKQRSDYNNPSFKVNKEHTSSLFRHRDFFHRVTWRPRDTDRYLSLSDGKPSHLVVQASEGALHDKTCTWKRALVSGNAPWLFRLCCWAVPNKSQKEKSSAGDIIVATGKAILIMPVQAVLLCFPMGRKSDWRHFYYKPILLKSWEYPLYAQNALEARPGQAGEQRDYGHRLVVTRENNRLLSPRKLVVLGESGWIVQTDTVDVPYIFISYTRLHWSPDDPRHRQSLQQLASYITRNAGLKAYWLDYQCIDPGPKTTADIHSICDVVRGAQQVTVAVKNLDNSTVADWGSRMWTLPEVLTCQNSTTKFYAADGSSMERSRIALSQTIWNYDQAARLLAEHFSGTLTLSRLQLIQEGLRALSKRDTSMRFSGGDIAYALMGLLNRRPQVNAQDNHFQALARMSLANDSDRVVERMICMLPPPRTEYTKQHSQPTYPSSLAVGNRFALENELNANLWDIEPICQVAGICSESGLLLDGCRGASIRWKDIPTIAYLKRASFKAKFLRILLRSGGIWLMLGVNLLIWYGITKRMSKGHGIAKRMFEGYGIADPMNSSGSWSAGAPPLLLVIGIIFVSFGVGMVVASPRIILALYSGKVWGAAHWLIGIEGTLPLEKIEKLTFGNSIGRLRWAPSSSRLAWKRHHERLGFEPEWTGGNTPCPNLPPGHRLFTLIDTGSMTVHSFSAKRPPTAAIIAGREGGMLRVLLCSYERSTNALTKETLLRMETPMLDTTKLLGWIKLV